MLSEIQSAIINFTRPNPAARRAMVRELVNQMRLHNVITYILQHRDHNADPPHSISKMKDDWPFLFSLKGLFSHFSELTGIPIQEKLPAATNNSPNIIEYFQQQKTPGVGKVLKAYNEESGNKVNAPSCACLLTSRRGMVSSSWLM